MNNGKPSHLTAHELLSKLSFKSESDPLLDEEDAYCGCTSQDVANTLRVRRQALMQAHAFAPGDLVTWKPGLKNRQLPQYGEPAIVLQVLSEPVQDTEQESGSTYFREPLSLVLGVLLNEGDRRGDFLAWHFDGRRFAHWK
ncbi:MAG: hypothetical protein Q4F13_10610 [Pseudomonadota bacterium]|nr:hypothetical protein [Pseudomonadota bacterium]